MSFSIKKEGEIVVVDVEGQLIVGNRQELKQKVLDELERGEKKFLIDFARPATSTAPASACSSRCRRRFASRAGSCGSRTSTTISRRCSS